MIVLPVNVNDQQHRGHIRSGASLPERVPALLSRPAIDAVGRNKAVFVLENKRGHLERDSIVNFLIAMILRFVPFVTHRVYTDCIAVPLVGISATFRLLFLRQSVNMQTVHA